MIPDTLIFDAEGVIVDSEKVWDHGQMVFLKRRGIVYDRDRVKPLLTGRSLVDGVVTLQKLYGIAGDPKQLAHERLEIVRRLFETEVNLVAGFTEFFENVRTKYKTCVATALSEDLLAIVDKRLALSKMFGGRVFTLAHVDHRSKPDPALFLYAAKRLGSRPQSCVVIEDAPLGIEAARNAEMRCIALSTTYDPASLSAADVVVRGFAEIDLPALAKGALRERVRQNASSLS